MSAINTSCNNMLATFDDINIDLLSVHKTRLDIELESHMNACTDQNIPLDQPYPYDLAFEILETCESNSPGIS